VYPHRRNYLRPRHPARDFVRRYASPRRNCERAGLCFFQPEIIMCFLSLRAQCFFKNLFIDFKFNDETTFYIEPPHNSPFVFKKKPLLTTVTSKICSQDFKEASEHKGERAHDTFPLPSVLCLCPISIWLQKSLLTSFTEKN
jgi:hypothetical protein